MKKASQILFVGILAVGIFGGLHNATKAQNAEKSVPQPSTYFSPTITKRTKSFPAKSIKLYGKTYKLVRYVKSDQYYLGYYQ